MPFRDDEEAARARADALERRLAEHDEELVECEAMLASRDAEIVERDAEIARLRQGAASLPESSLRW